MDPRTLAKQAKLTQVRLKELLHYDPETGVFAWLVSWPQAGIMSGDVAGGISGDASKELNGSGYWRIRVDGVRYRAHRLAWLYMTGDWPHGDIDHENRNRSDNRWINLRPATRVQNGHNRSPSKKNTSGTCGVWERNGRWVAMIRNHGKAVFYGMFYTKEDAVLAIEDARVRLHLFAPSA